MEEETLQFIIRHLNGLKTDIINEVRTDINDVKTDVKMDIRAVAIGQDDLKEELKTDINDVKVELKNDMKLRN
jgi:hypothetical protein